MREGLSTTRTGKSTKVSVWAELSNVSFIRLGELSRRKISHAPSDEQEQATVEAVMINKNLRGCPLIPCIMSVYDKIYQG